MGNEKLVYFCFLLSSSSSSFFLSLNEPFIFSKMHKAIFNDEENKLNEYHSADVTELTMKLMNVNVIQ